MSISVLRLSGTPEAMGYQHGESMRDRIRELADIRIDLIRNSRDVSSDVIQATAEAVAAEILRQVPDVYCESAATARAAGLDYWKLVVAGGFSDIYDAVGRHEEPYGGGLLAECTLLPPQPSPEGVLLAGTWDSHAIATPALIVVERWPDLGPATLALSTVGWPMQQGVTAAGVAFAIANLVSRTARRGISYIAALPEIVAAGDFDAVTERTIRFTLCSARFYTFVSADGRGLAVETDGVRYWSSTSGLIHTNHFIMPGADEAEGRGAAITSSRERLDCASRRLLEIGQATSESLLDVLMFNNGTEGSLFALGSADDDRTGAAFVLNATRRSLTFVTEFAGTPLTYLLRSANHGP